MCVCEGGGGVRKRHFTGNPEGKQPEGSLRSYLAVRPRFGILTLILGKGLTFENSNRPCHAQVSSDN